jgi:hypothetical protein
MPVLPNPDPQMWRMLLGDRAEEILGRDGKDEGDTATQQVFPPGSESNGDAGDEAGKDTKKTLDRQNRDDGG